MVKLYGEDDIKRQGFYINPQGVIIIKWDLLGKIVKENKMNQIELDSLMKSNNLLIWERVKALELNT